MVEETSLVSQKDWAAGLRMVVWIGTGGIFFVTVHEINEDWIVVGTGGGDGMFVSCFILSAIKIYLPDTAMYIHRHICI